MLGALAIFFYPLLRCHLQAVQVKLTGEPMMNFLEKLVYMVLPNQIGFEGATHPQVWCSSVERRSVCESVGAVLSGT